MKKYIRLTYLLAFVFALSLFASIAIKSSYIRTLRPYPEPAQGRVIPFNYEGLHVYLNSQEDLVITLLRDAMLATFTGLLLKVWYDKSKR